MRRWSLQQHRPLRGHKYEPECATDEIIFSTHLVFIRNVEPTKITSRHVVAGVLLVIIEDLDCVPHQKAVLSRMEGAT